MAGLKKVITRDEWEKKMNDVKIRKEDMNKLVMNFLVTEGYVDAAEKFQMESGTKPDMDLATITDRMAVKKAVQCGNIEDAIEKVNDLNPEILDTNPQLFFHLQQQRMIELIRNGKIEEALEFAQEELAPRGEENQCFLDELERTVALLAFEDASTCPVGELLDISQRLKTAGEVNSAILTSQSHEKDPKLPRLLKMLMWAQTQLDEKAAYPRINDLSAAALEDPTQIPGYEWHGSAGASGSGTVPEYPSYYNDLCTRMDGLRTGIDGLRTGIDGLRTGFDEQKRVADERWQQQLEFMTYVRGHFDPPEPGPNGTPPHYF